MKKILVLIIFQLVSNNSFSQQILSANWIFIYYMPYDNNLSYLGEDIISMIKEGITSDEVLAVVQADFRDTTGMYRYIITKNNIIKSHIKNENSAKVESYEQYLNWVASNFEFKKSSVIFLNHGGKLDELCLDEWPKKSFLRVDSIRHTLGNFCLKQNKKIDLLFLQVCTKGSIEPLYEFKDVAEYTLSSQTVLGAPNYYYKNLFEDICNNPNKSGLDIANLICDYEREDMYNSYTCLSNSKLLEFKAKYRRFIDYYQNQLSIISEPISVNYLGEDYWDIISFLCQIKVSDSVRIKIRNELIDFIENELIVIHKQNPKKGWIGKYSGLSITPPSKFGKYEHLLFFHDFTNGNNKRF